MFLVFAFSGSSSKNSTRVIVDCSGARVEIPVEINKVVNVCPSAVAFMTAMGLDSNTYKYNY